MVQRVEREPQDKENLPPLSREALEPWLDAFRQRLGGRAAGLWRATDSELVSLGYSFDEGIADDVRIPFQAATQRAALTQTQFGIVAAAASRSTVIATLVTGPEGSQSWLARLGASFSCATPILVGEKLVGALAIALPAQRQASPAETSAITESLEEIAGQIAAAGLLE